VRIWIAIAVLALGIAAAHAIPSAQQIIIFGGNSSASGSGGGGTGCTGTSLSFTTACNSMYVPIIH